MNYDAHWQALYDNMRAGLDGAGFNAVPILAINSQDQQVAEELADPPYVLYTQETHRAVGTPAGKHNKVVKTGWRITVRSQDLQDMLDISSALSDKFELEDIATTTDGYVTIGIDPLGYQTLWETDSKLNAAHMRYDWERSK